MSSPGPQASSGGAKAKEMDSVKESISDIINQLQDIDPARLSFSPFLDLDTQISMAPVSDSPESSVEELRSSSRSVSGSQRSLEPPRAASAPCDGDVGGASDQSRRSPVRPATPTPHGTAQNRLAAPPASTSEDDVPNGADTPPWGPEEPRPDGGDEEGRPLVAPPHQSLELGEWGGVERGQTPGGGARASERGRRRPCCGCCGSGRGQAVASALGSLLCAGGLGYALYFHLPLRTPHLPDAHARMLFALCCCLMAATPVLLAMLVGVACQFCSGSLAPFGPVPRRRAVQQLFVSASAELLLLYSLNLLVMAALLPDHHLRLVPIMAAMFVLGRMIYWLSLGCCSLWRGFGSGLSFFPLLAMAALNVFLLYRLGLQQQLFSSPAGPSGEPAVPPTDVPDAQ